MNRLTACWRGLAAAPLPAGLDAWARELAPRLDQKLASERHGELTQWLALLAQLPEVRAGTVDLAAAAVRIGAAAELAAAARQDLKRLLLALHPWRKGPFQVFGIDIDAEWRSDLKWARLAPHVAPLQDRLVLDVGCGNGYYALRMLGAGAQRVIGIDPTLRYVMQFAALRHFLDVQTPAHVLPLSLEDVPADLRAFDTVFSMGVLYHRRSPLDHLLALRDLLRPGGELVLETLVVPGDEHTVLLPPGRYAKMRNVWFLPSVAALEGWLRRCGYRQVRSVDATPTTLQEQRRTEWMQFHSLADFLDPADAERTAEGLPAPRRALVLANCP